MGNLLLSRLVICLGICLLAAFARAQSSVDAVAPASASELLQAFKSAVTARDEPAALALFDWHGVSDEMKAFHREMIQEIIRYQFTNASLAPLPPKDPIEFDAGGVHYAMSIRPVGIIALQSADPLDSPPVVYGTNNGRYYLAALTERTLAVSDEETNDVRLIKVQDAAGRPVTNVAVVCATPDTIPDYVCHLLIGGVRKFWTDARGQFALPLSEPDLYLVAASARGFGWVQPGQLTNHTVMVIHSWARIEGRHTNRGYPVGNEHLSLSLDRDFYQFGAKAPIKIGGRQTRTDADGRFVFDDVPPLKLFIDRQERQRGYWGYFWSVDATQGGPQHLDIVTHGRTVTGRLIRGPGLATNLDLTECSGALMSDLPGRVGSRCSVGFPFSADGAFVADHVEPGDYKMTGDIRRNGQLIARIDPSLVHVPDYTSSVPDVPFAIGTVTLKEPVNFMRGDVAPDFASQTLDEHPFKLSDFRGKYVLLDFWATWCGPCVAETPNLKATYEAFGKDPRFVMISLSLDADRAAPQKFARSHDIAWMQAFLGPSSKDKVAGLYGVYGIPAIFLIGPDGKVLATGLRGAKIKETVATVLKD